MAADAAYVYWTTTDGPEPTSAGTVYRANKDGSAQIALVLGWPAPNGIAVDDTYVYWTITNGASFPGHPSIARCAIAGCGGTPTVLANGQNGPFQLAVDSANVYWTNAANGPNGTVMRLAK
jgi:hypothetical protein